MQAFLFLTALAAASAVDCRKRTMLLDMALRYHPDIICVGEMRSAEAYAAQEAARTGHGVLTTIHSNSSQATWRRMVTLCKRKHEMADDRKTR